MAEPAAAVAAAAAGQVQDLADLLSKRSPGTRTQDELTKHARAASNARPQPKKPNPAGRPAPPEIASTAQLIDLLQPPVVPVEVADLQPPLAPPPTLGAIIESTPGTAVTPPGDPGPVTFPKSEPREELPPTSAVPEPASWAMMLLGFGLIGWQSRRRRANSGKAVRRAAR